MWDLPGGHVQPGETPAAALVRELSEELGVLISPPAGPPWRTLSDDEAGITLAIWVVEHAGPVENRAPHEHDALVWASADDLGAMALADPAYEGLLLEVLDRS